MGAFTILFSHGYICKPGPSWLSQSLSHTKLCSQSQGSGKDMSTYGTEGTDTSSMLLLYWIPAKLQMQLQATSEAFIWRPGCAGLDSFIGDLQGEIPNITSLPKPWGPKPYTAPEKDHSHQPPLAFSMKQLKLTS